MSYTFRGRSGFGYEVIDTSCLRGDALSSNLVVRGAFGYMLTSQCTIYQTTLFYTQRLCDMLPKIKVMKI